MEFFKVGKNEDIVGNLYGSMKVLSSQGTDKWGSRLWKCECITCGRIKVWTTSRVLRKTGKCTCNLTYEGRNLLNKVVGNLVVVEKTDQRKDLSVVWKCLCSCGNTCYVSSKHLLRSLPTRSCGCLTYTKNPAKGRPYKGGDLVGKRFGKLLVLNQGETKKQQRIWFCICDCGNTTSMTTTSLIRRNRSCGCMSPRFGKLRGKEVYNYTGHEEITGTRWNSIKNGAVIRGLIFSITKEQVWELYMKQNKLCAYSGVAISFLDKTASLDRIDNTRGYEVGNIAIVHKHINKMKNNLTLSEFFNFCALVTAFRSGITL